MTEAGRVLPAGPAVQAGGSGFLLLPVTAVLPSPWIELALADGAAARLAGQMRVSKGMPRARAARADTGTSG